MSTVETSPERAWDMAVYSLTTAASAVYQMSKSDTYRDLAVKDLGQVSEAALAINLAWSILRARENA
jgi:hypothetical protein